MVVCGSVLYAPVGENLFVCYTQLLYCSPAFPGITSGPHGIGCLSRPVLPVVPGMVSAALALDMGCGSWISALVFMAVMMKWLGLAETPPGCDGTEAGAAQGSHQFTSFK